MGDVKNLERRAEAAFNLLSFLFKLFDAERPILNEYRLINLTLQIIDNIMTFHRVD